MLDRYAQLYPKIADELGRALPRGWTKTWVQVEMDTNTGSVVVFYVSPAQPEPGWITPPLKLYEYFRVMNNAARLEGAAWTSATLVLAPDDRVEVDFGYDPIPIEDENDRLEAWKRRYLPT